MGKRGGGGNASSVRVEPTLHRHTVSMTISEKADCTAVERCQADRKGQVLVQCREPKTGQQKVQLSSKTKHFAHLGMINLCAPCGPAGCVCRCRWPPGSVSGGSGWPPATAGPVY